MKQKISYIFIILFADIFNGYIEETYVLHRQLFYLHEMLEPESSYRVSVWAETIGGEGPFITRPVRTWPERSFIY